MLRSQRGFTLLELLVVLIIISIFFGMSALAIRDSSEDKLREETLRLQALLQLAKEKALFENQNIGLHFYDQGYGFIVEDSMPDPNEPEKDIDFFSLVDKKLGDKTLRRRDLPQKFTLFLSAEENDIGLKSSWPSDDDINALQPHTMFYSSGENMPFTIEVNFDNKIRRRLSVNALGKITLEALEYL